MRLAIALLPLLLAVVPARAEDRLPRLRLPPEWAYVFEDDDAQAARLLEPLLKRYGDARACDRLLDVLRKRKPRASRVPDRVTIAVACPDGKERSYSWIAPRSARGRKPVGVLIWLHGAIRQPAPGGGANEAGMFAPAVDDLDLVVIGPSTFEGVEWGSPACRFLVHRALDDAKRCFDVDEDRVYLAGDSDGGRGTYAICETEATFLAAAVPVIGAPGGVTRFANLKNLPFFAINGDQDTIFDIGRVRESVEAMQHSGIDLAFEVAKGVGHDPRLFLTYGEQVRRFLKEHARNPFPREVGWQWEPGEGYESGFPANTFRWIRIDATGTSASNGTFDDPAGSLLARRLPRIRAVRDGQRVDVVARDVTRYSVLVSPEMFDLDEEIEIHTNGALSWRGRVEPDARVVLEEMRRFRDRKLLFVARIPIEPGGSGGD